MQEIPQDTQMIWSKLAKLRNYDQVKNVWEKSDVSKCIHEENWENGSEGGFNTYLCIGYIIYGGKISVLALKDFVTIRILTGYVPECTIISS